MTTNYRYFSPSLMARAAVTRIANANPKAIEDIEPAMGDYATRMTKAELVIVIGYLAKWVLKNEGGA